MASNKHALTAVITDKRGRVLSIGQNSYVKTHPLQAHYAKKVGLHHKVYLHAEMSAIVKCRDLSKAHKISIFRYNKKGDPMYAKPCPICQNAIEIAGIKNIEYTVGDKIEKTAYSKTCFD